MLCSHTNTNESRQEVMFTRDLTDLSPAALGLDNLYNLTSMTKMTLRVDLRDEDEAVFAKYSTFELVKRNYKLIVDGYSGTAGWTG